MPVCVVAKVDQSTGTPFLALDLTRPDLSTCPYVIDDGASNAWQELGNMTLEQSSQIGVAIGLVWAIAWGIKQVIRALRVDEVKEFS